MPGDLWTTAGVADAQIEAYWSRCVNRALLEMEVEIADAARFTGTLRRRSSGRLQVVRATIEGPQTLRRTATLASRCDAPRYVLLRMRSGAGWLRHRGGEIPLPAGECVLLDSREAWELSVDGGTDSLVFLLPADLVESHLPDPRVVLGLPLGHQPWAPTLGTVMETLHADREYSPPLVARNLCSALALTVDAIEIRSTRHSRKTFLSLQRTLADLASTCNVTAGEIAQAHGVSLRYLHAIYSANGTSCGRELIRVRLEKAQRLLQDPAATGRSIDEIAWCCGFSDPSHFRRRFRALYGRSPSQMRGAPARTIHALE